MVDSKQTIVDVDQTDADRRLAIQGLEIVLSCVPCPDYTFGGRNSHVPPIFMSFSVQPAFVHQWTKSLLEEI